ncbi:hypothetical protein AVEN_266103-1 [Araneus ventricosus]|uniref:Uncharacterized protein n=1 Tax=Araneus ventricosus TaxID=182803 RepID=A0A4Y2R9D6_ARAVE|nr:hypothetical protein AVEN_266103-1 [Araneus ventricosus]
METRMTLERTTSSPNLHTVPTYILEGESIIHQACMHGKSSVESDLEPRSWCPKVRRDSANRLPQLPWNPKTFQESYRLFVKSKR